MKLEVEKVKWSQNDEKGEPHGVKLDLGSTTVIEIIAIAEVVVLLAVQTLPTVEKHRQGCVSGPSIANIGAPGSGRRGRRAPPHPQHDSACGPWNYPLLLLLLLLLFSLPRRLHLLLIDEERRGVMNLGILYIFDCSSLICSVQMYSWTLDVERFSKIEEFKI